MSDRFIPGPHPFVIPMLLAMSQDQENFEKILDDLIQVIQSTKNAMQSMRSGMETFHAGMVKVAFPPSGKAGQKGPAEISTQPVKGAGNTPAQES
ncbi:MAG: hypothetical protein M1130_13160 [Actinobacteria bacterium]|nr:hypothetical protein [Actinomycetota bacterium]